jgi:hypothetical protein
LGYNPEGYDLSELRALLEVSALPDSHLKLVFLEEALRDPATAERFVRRTQEAVQAAIGASPARRKAALALASSVQRDPKADIRCRTAACWLKLELGIAEAPALMEAFKDLSHRRELGRSGLLAYLPLLPQAEVAPLVETLVVTFVSESDRSYGRLDPPELDVIKEAIAGCVERLDGTKAQALLIEWSDKLISVLDRKPGILVVGCAARPLTVCLRRLDGAEAQPWIVKWSETLFRLIDREKDSNTLLVVAGALAECLERLDMTTARPLLIKRIESTTSLLDRERDSGTIRAAARKLEACVIGLDASIDRALLIRVCESLTRSIETQIGVLDQQSGSETLRAIGEAIVACAIRLDQPASQSLLINAVETLIGLMRQETDGFMLWAADGALEACVTRLDSSTAQFSLIKWGETFVSLLGRQKKGYVGDSAHVKAFVACVERLDMLTAQSSLIKWIDALIGMLGQEKDDYKLQDIRVAFAASVKQLDVRRSRQCFAKWSETLIGLLVQEKNIKTVLAIQEALRACVERLDVPVARHLLIKACETLIGLLTNEEYFYYRLQTVESLAACVVRLDKVTAQDLLMKTSETLFGLLRNEKTFFPPSQTAEALAVCLGRLDKPLAKSLLINTSEMLIERLRPKSEVNSIALDSSAAELAMWVRRSDGAVKDPLLFKASEKLIGLLIKDVSLVSSPGIGSALTECMEKLDSHDTNKLALRAISIEIETLTSSGNFSEGMGTSFESFSSMLSHVRSRQELARFLKSSGCVLNVREAILHRSEELCFPMPPTIPQRFATASVIESLNGSAGPGLLSGITSTVTLAERHTQRRFRTIWDAVAWFDENEPGMDWDSPWKPSAEKP